MKEVKYVKTDNILDNNREKTKKIIKCLKKKCNVNELLEITLIINQYGLELRKLFLIS